MKITNSTHTLKTRKDIAEKLGEAEVLEMCASKVRIDDTMRYSAR